MQKNLGYVIPSLVIPDATTGIGYWYLGNVPLGVRATGTMWTIGEDHYWYVDNTKTDYLAEIPVEVYNAQWQEMITNFNQQWTTYFTDKTAEIDLWFNTAGASFTLWFNRMKNQLSTDAAGNLQAQIDQIGYNFSDYVEPYTISSQAYAVGTYIVHNNQTFEVVKAIAQGDTFNSDESDANHNIEARTIGETMELVADNIKYDHTSSALSAADVQAAIDEIVNTLLKASDNLKFQFTKSGGKYGYKDSNGNFVPFKVVQASKTVTAGTSAQTVTPDSGYDGVASVTVNPTPSQSKSASPSTSAQTISPDSGKLLSSVSISAISPQRTAGVVNDKLCSIDSTGPFAYFPQGWWPLVDTSSWGGPSDASLIRFTNDQARAMHAHSNTYNVFRTGTKDMGRLHNFRYINCQPLWRIYDRSNAVTSSDVTVSIDTKENQAQQYVMGTVVIGGTYQWDFTPHFILEGSNNNSSWTKIQESYFPVNMSGGNLIPVQMGYDTYAYSNIQRTRYRYYRMRFTGGPSSGIDGFIDIFAIVCHTLSDV